MCLFWTFPFKGILWYVVFCNWLLTVSISKVRVNCGHVSSSFLLVAEYSIVWMWVYLSFVFPYSVDKHLGCFYLLAITNNTAIDRCMHVFAMTYGLFLLGMHLGAGLMSCIRTPCSSCEGLPDCFQSDIPFYTPLTLRGCPLFASLPTLVVIWCWASSCPDECPMGLIMILICISLMAVDGESVFLCFWAICVSSMEKCIFSFAH